MITLRRDAFPDEVMDMTVSEPRTLFVRRAASSPRTDRTGKQLIADWFAELSAEKKRRRHGGQS